MTTEIIITIPGVMLLMRAFFLYGEPGLAGEKATPSAIFGGSLLILAFIIHLFKG
jgi:hypothetical protein